MDCSYSCRWKILDTYQCNKHNTHSHSAYTRRLSAFRHHFLRPRLHLFPLLTMPSFPPRAPSKLINQSTHADRGQAQQNELARPANIRSDTFTYSTATNYLWMSCSTTILLSGTPVSSTAGYSEDRGDSIQPLTSSPPRQTIPPPLPRTVKTTVLFT